MIESRVLWHLDNWADWQRSYHLRLGLPARASCMASTGMTDFEGMADDADSYAAHATEAAITALAPAQRGAIERKYEICAVYQYPRHNFLDMLRQGMQRLSTLLPAQGLV